MKPEILKWIAALGGDIADVTGASLEADLQAITFGTVLYPRPDDTPWLAATDTEPLYGLEDFIVQHRALFFAYRPSFYKKLEERYYRLTDEGLGQMFYKGTPFTPFREGTPDFEEWNGDFTDDAMIDLSEVLKITNDATPDFVLLCYSYGFPDHFYVCLSDPDPENPTVFGTDHEVFFNEISNEGTMENFFKRFLTKAEVEALTEARMAQKNSGL